MYICALRELLVTLQFALKVSEKNFSMYTDSDEWNENEIKFTILKR